MWRITMPHCAALLEDVHAEAADALLDEREVDLEVLLELHDLRSRSSLVDDRLISSRSSLF
jgi:hypothetical protein